MRGMTSTENEGLVREETPRAVAIGVGVFLTAFGSVFGGFPLWALIGILQYGGYSIGQIIIPIAIFSLFILIGSLLLFLGLKSLVAGITGQGLTTYVRKEHHLNGADVDLSPQYISEEELLKQIHGTGNPGVQAIVSTEENPQPSTAGGFWGEIKGTDDEA